MVWFVGRKRRRWDIDDIFDYIDMQIFRMFDIFRKGFRDFWYEGYPEFLGEYNLIEDEDRYIIEIGLPGVDKKDIDIEVRDSHLIISVRKKAKEERKEEGFYISKRYYSGFRKVIPLPPDADTDKIKAKYENGILRIEIERIPSGGKKINLD